MSEIKFADGKLAEQQKIDISRLFSLFQYQKQFQPNYIVWTQASRSAWWE